MRAQIRAQTAAQEEALAQFHQTVLLSLEEVENALVNIAGVREAAVIGVPDPLLGMAIKAIVAAEDGLTERDVIRHCAARLEDFMVPSIVEFRGQLPKSENGKIARKELAAA